MADEVDYKVHSILDMKIELEETGFVYYYLIDWGDGISKPNWEPSYNLSCPSKIREYKNKQKKANAENKMSSMTTVQQRAYVKMLKEEDAVDKEIRQKFEELCRSSPYPIAFNRQLNIRRIINAFEHKGKLIYVVAWKNSNKVDAIPAKICNVMIPEHVIDFLESKLWVRNDRGVLVKWGYEEDEKFDNPWGKTPEIRGEIYSIEYNNYDKESSSQSEFEEEIEQE
ncbi:unnamed protein product [Brassicogethes aeneus]|uniref:Chromo domain-containing protein n=1 Tax=Brassicogethes aeneus TaxID=1431903 RepID=A0A9P0ASL1_BRAAE|nr:unnamed protein product [Brassicogethes aeneus]